MQILTPATIARRRRPGLWRLLVAFACTAVLAGLLPGVAPLGQVAAADLPLHGVIIVIDPGHNGGNGDHPEIISTPVWIGTGWKRCNSVGASARSGFQEHRLNYLVARRVRARLVELGATVVMTRTGDSGVGPCIDVRGSLGTRVHAALLVSIHADSAPSYDHGFFICRPSSIAGWTDDISARSYRLAKAIRAGMLARNLPIANYYATNGLITRDDLGTLNWSDVPAVLVELGNMRNRSDAARMESSTGRARYASGLVAGIRRYLGR